MLKVLKQITFCSFKKKVFAAALMLIVCSVAILWNAHAKIATLDKNMSDPNAVLFLSQNRIDISSRGHIPEPSTLALIGSGFVAVLVRFARRRFRDFKRCFDIGASVLGLFLSVPLMVGTAIVIKIVSPGPVFFKQMRVGKDGKLFEIFKIRTMVCDAENQTGAVWAKKNDPRIFPFGNFLRKAHIDEIPQLVNVLKGEMSIVGPRPERPEFVSTLSEKICDYKKRLGVMPGITGLAQVKHNYDRTTTDVRKKVKLDLLYIRRMCFLIDLRILYSTFFVVLTGRGAH
jgi:lipopolysaccharide/colanic/teichoic acid biosynthesis glycosyltransferase